MTEALGWLSTVLLALCGLPLLFSTKFGDRLFLLCWLGGEVLGLAYILDTSQQWPLLVNYGFNTLLVSFVLARRYHA